MTSARSFALSSQFAGGGLLSGFEIPHDLPTQVGSWNICIFSCLFHCMIDSWHRDIGDAGEKWQFGVARNSSKAL